MVRFQEGGVLTQKVNMALISAVAVSVLVLATCMVAYESEAAANGFVEFDNDVVKIEGVAEATIRLDVSDAYEHIGITYKAKLVDAGGATQTDAVSPSTGSLSPFVPEVLKVTAPKDAGKYRLIVTYTYSLDDGDDKTVVKEAILKVVEPILLSVDITNTSDVDVLDLLLDFYVDGKKVNQDPVGVGKVAAGETVTATYEHAAYALSGSHRFMASVSDSSLIADNISGLDVEHTFQIGQKSHTWMNVLMAIILVIIVMVAIYVHRKPVKNYGKPKARR